MVPVLGGQGTLPDVESCWDAVAAAASAPTAALVCDGPGALPSRESCSDAVIQAREVDLRFFHMDLGSR